MTAWSQYLLSCHYNDCLMSMCDIKWLQWLFDVNVCNIICIQWLLEVNICYHDMSLQWLFDVNVWYQMTTMTVWCQCVILFVYNDCLKSISVIMSLQWLFSVNVWYQMTTMTVWCQCVILFVYNDCLKSISVIMSLQWLFSVNVWYQMTTMTVWCQCVILFYTMTAWSQYQLSCHYNDCLMSMCDIKWLQWLFAINV